MATTEELRLMARIARMYYIDGVRQPEIASRLDLSQARVSRLLKRAEEENVVRISIMGPSGTFANLESLLQRRFGLRVALVAEAESPNEVDVLPALGATAAYYLETTLRHGDLVGIASWSQYVRATVDAMQPQPLRDVRVLQMFGGTGSPNAPVHANWLTQRFADLLSARPVFLPSPGVAGSPESARALREDPFVRSAMQLFRDISVAVIGLAPVQPSPLLASSGNVFSHAELLELEQAGAVGNTCLRFYDAAGRPIETPLTERVVGISFEELMAIPRRIAIAGGSRSFEAIRAGLTGGIANVLVTDQFTATSLLERDGSSSVK